MQNNYTKHRGGIVMAEQVLIQFRADKALKQEVAEISVVRAERKG